MSDKRLDNLVRQMEGRCHHFNGIQNKCCAAGVNYRELAGIEMGMVLVLPCLPEKTFETKRREEMKEAIRECPKLRRTTHEEAVAEAEEFIEHSTKVMAVKVAAHEDAKKRGFKKGSGGQAEMPCPSGCGGKLHYSVASYNGHMHARCTTANCASWME